MIGIHSDKANSAGLYFPNIHAHGGAERLCLQLAYRLSAMGFRTTIYTDVVVDRARIEAEFGGPLGNVVFVTLHEPSLPKRLPGEPRRLLTLASHARQLRAIDLGLFVNARFKSQLPGCGRTNVYYVHFPHRLEVKPRGKLHQIYLAAARWCETRLIDRSRAGFATTYDRVWANSEFTGSHVLSRWGFPSEVLYPPCDQIPMMAKERLIAVLGRFQRPEENVPYKAQDVLIRAFKRLKRAPAAEGWRLVMLGGLADSDRAYFRSLLDLAQGDEIELIANGSRGQVADLLGRASLYWHAQGYGSDATLFPEAQEHFGIGVVEAMSAGAIPLVYGNAGPAEIVADVGGGPYSWSSMEELVDVSQQWIVASEAERAQAAAAVRVRAGEFDDYHFAARLGELLDDVPGLV